VDISRFKTFVIIDDIILRLLKLYVLFRLKYNYNFVGHFKF